MSGMSGNTVCIVITLWYVDSRGGEACCELAYPVYLTLPYLAASLLISHFFLYFRTLILLLTY